MHTEEPEASSLADPRSRPATERRTQGRPPQAGAGTRTEQAARRSAEPIARPAVGQPAALQAHAGRQQVPGAPLLPFSFAREVSAPAASERRVRARGGLCHTARTVRRLAFFRLRTRGTRPWPNHTASRPRAICTRHGRVEQTVGVSPEADILR